MPILAIKLGRIDVRTTARRSSAFLLFKPTVVAKSNIKRSISHQNEDDFSFEDSQQRNDRRLSMAAPSRERSASRKLSAAAGHINTTKSTKDNIDLKHILADESLRKEFLQFLSKEFALESLAFIEAVVQYRKSFDTTTLDMNQVTASANQIFRDFLNPSAVNEVNVPVKVVKEVRAAVKSLANGTLSVTDAEHMFDAPANEISVMLSTNYLVKFKKSLKSIK